MSKYTTELRFICENKAGLIESTGYNSTMEIIQKARPHIFDFSYPIFDETYRSVLETKILKHFYTREIGAESVGLWKLWLDTRLNEIMPYYNKMYESELLQFNPFYDVDITTDHKKDNAGSENVTDNYSETNNKNGSENGTGQGKDTTSGEQNGGSKIDRWEYFSDTPQGGVTGLADMNYLTNASHVTDDGSQSKVTNAGENNSESSYASLYTEDNTRTGNNTRNNILNNTEDYLEHVKGKTAGASYSSMLKEYRQTFLNIDMQVINDLNDLFMNLW